MNYQPLIIIGAPRSGTNMLRDVLCKLDGIATWPCDEINYIWRHGNVKQSTDEFDKSFAESGVKSFIRKEFDKFAYKENVQFLVEKTCANSLRVPFVEEVVPEAKYIFMVRDGVDVVGSASLRWKAKLEIPYILKKVRYVPVVDLPYYAFRYLSSRVYRLFSNEGRLSFWGPQFNGLDHALMRYSLEEVCAIQWQRCVDLAEDAFCKMPEGKVIRVSYEAFVTEPAKELTRLLEKFNVDHDALSANKAVSGVTDKNIGKGRNELTKNQLDKVTRLLSSTLNRCGYEN